MNDDDQARIAEAVGQIEERLRGEKPLTAVQRVR